MRPRMGEPGRPVKTLVADVLRSGSRRPSMIALKITQIGESVAIILNADALAALGAGVGDTVYIDHPHEAGTAEMSFDPRRQRSRYFLKRIQKTFEGLAEPRQPGDAGG